MIIAYGIALLIPILALYLIYALDLFGTGKVGTVALCMVWGATFAAGLAFIANNLLATAFGYAIAATLVGPIVEEVLKSLILIYFVRNPRFLYSVDGAIYGFGVGIGFSITENLVYLSSGRAGLALTISRVLSTSLMHATASALVGVSLGRMRRTQGVGRGFWQLFGLIAAILIHIVFNTVVDSPQLEGRTLLLVGVGLGAGGSAIIAFLILRGIEDERRSFDKTLTLDVGVSAGERKSVQRLGESTLESILEDLSANFGGQNINLVHSLLVKQANIGILQNNLMSANLSVRLRRAWESEIAALQTEVAQIRQELGAPILTYLRSMFPTDDLELWNAVNAELAATDPTLVDTFDMFMRVSQMSEIHTAEQLESIADRLHQITIFKYIPLPDLENLSRAISVVSFRDGEMIFDQGDEGDTMYLIETGEINLYKIGEAKQELFLRTFRAGDAIGDFAVLDGQPRTARARAAGTVTVLALTRHVFMMFIQSRPQVVLAVLQVLAEKARYTTASVEKAIQMLGNFAPSEYKELVLKANASDPANVDQDTPQNQEPSIGSPDSHV